MNCYFHPQEEGVVACGKCGVALCRDCEAKAFFRLNGGTGQALCKRCSLTEEQAIVDFEASYLSKRFVKLIFISALILLGIVAFFYFRTEGTGYGVFAGGVLWLISSCIGTFGAEETPKTYKQQMQEVVDEVRHPFATGFTKIILIVFKAFFAPVFLLVNYIGYARTKSEYKKDLELLETIKASMNEA